MFYNTALRFNRYLKSKALENRLEDYAFIKWGEPEAKLMRFFADKSAYAFDVGSNVGEYASIMSKHFLRVIAVDANPRCCNHLKNKLGNKVEIINTALSNEEGTLALHIPRSANGMSGCATLEPHLVAEHDAEVIDVPVVMLDSLAKNYAPVSFVKIDVEGHEYKVLQGALQTIKQHKPSFLIEIEYRHNASSFENVLNLLENFGYSGFFIEKKQLIPIMNFNKETHQDVDVLFGRKKSEHPYINNFFFTTKSDLIEKIKHAIA